MIKKLIGLLFIIAMVGALAVQHPGWAIGAGVFLLAILMAASSQKRCGICNNILKKTRYQWTLEGKKTWVCPHCNRQLESRASKRAISQRFR